MNGIKIKIFGYIGSIVYFFLKAVHKLYYYGLYRGYRRKYQVSNTFEFVGEGILLEGGGNIVLGNHSHIARRSWLSAFPHTTIKIGNNTRIASNVTMITSNTKAKQNFSKSMERSEGDIFIGDNCWIGVNVYIKEGVSVGDNVVIGANSVITKNVPNNSIVVGVNRMVANVE